MKNKLKTLLIALILSSLISQKINAAYDDLGISARAIGMGNAFTAVADDVYSIYYNPAGLATIERPEIATTYANLYPGLTDNSTLQNSFFGYAQPLKGGKQGTLGLGLNRFSLNGFYQESSFYASYGREIKTQLLPGTLYGGVTFKYLDRSLSGIGNLASQPLGPTGQVMTGVTDSVLAHTSKSNFDMDLGLLYRPAANWNFGFTSQHILEPNVAFDPTQAEPLVRDYKFGAAYRTPFATLSGDYDMIEEPDTSMGEIISLGAEKWFPTLAHGTFGIRGGLSEGSLDFRQISLGLSYRIFRMEFDYGFELPISGLSMGTYGTQRFGMTFRFGETPEEHAAYGEALLENTGMLAQVGTAEFKYQAGRLALFKQQSVASFLDQAQTYAKQGNFAKALERINQAVSLSPRDVIVAESQARMAVVAQVYPRLENFADNAQTASVYVGIIQFLAENNKQALDDESYALSLNPADLKVQSLIKAMEAISGKAVTMPSVAIPAPKPVAPAAPSKQLPPQKAAAPQIPSKSAASIQAAKNKFVEGGLAIMEVNLGLKQYDKVIAMGREVIKADPTNALAYLRMGAAYYALKQYAKAGKAFRLSHRYETDPEALKKIQAALDALDARKKTAPHAKVGARRHVSAAPPQKIESLYEAGVELYSQGKLKEAESLFQKLLDIAPHYAPAQKALQRVKAEETQSGGLP